MCNTQCNFHRVYTLLVKKHTPRIQHKYTVQLTPCIHITCQKIDVLQSRPSAGGHKILNFTSKILDFLTTGYLPFCDFFYVFSRVQLCILDSIRLRFFEYITMFREFNVLRFLEGIAMFRGFNVITFFRRYSYIS